MELNKYLDVAPEVAAALAAGKPVVALESTARPAPSPPPSPSSAAG